MVMTEFSGVINPDNLQYLKEAVVFLSSIVIAAVSSARKLDLGITQLTFLPEVKKEKAKPKKVSVIKPSDQGQDPLTQLINEEIADAAAERSRTHGP